ncbi:MAG: neutral/alkaline non-lysosomal ceramidase N-terminal domain-containing protein [Acidobacteriota bacterium]
MINKLLLLATVVLATAFTSALPLQAQGYRAGIARRDITPEGPIWMAGYGSRDKPSQGVEQPLFAKALALQDPQGKTSVLVTLDLIGITREFGNGIAEQVQQELGIARRNLMIVSSHTHTGPAVFNQLRGMFALDDDNAALVKAYEDRLASEILVAIAQAVSRIEAAELAFAHGHANFAANRRVFTPRGVNFGVNPEGPVDHDVPVLRVQDSGGNIRAIVFGYACHGTTLTGDDYRISGDWPGFAQEYLEQGHPGATAFFVTGCGADANPEPRGKLYYARQHGLNMAGAVTAVLTQPMAAVEDPLSCAFDYAELPLAEPPSRQEFEKRLQDQNRFVRRHAERNIERLDQHGKLVSSYGLPVQVWRFGDDLTLVAIAGEVVVDYALRLKRELGPERLWVAGYANDVPAYIPSARILLEGGYEADHSMIYYDLPTRWAPTVEETLIKKIHELVEQAKTP